MTSVLLLDRSEPAVNDLVAAWTNGGEYTLQVKVKQVTADDAKATFDVLEVTDMSTGEPEVEEEAEAPAPKAPKTMASMPGGEYSAKK